MCGRYHRDGPCPKLSLVVAARPGLEEAFEDTLLAERRRSIRHLALLRPRDPPFHLLEPVQDDFDLGRARFGGVLLDHEKTRPVKLITL
jgi:hypothetical protein